MVNIIQFNNPDAQLAEPDHLKSPSAQRFVEHLFSSNTSNDLRFSMFTCSESTCHGQQK